MIGRWASKKVEAEDVKPSGFDAFELRLGDLMRGERATLGKSLLDVQRELRIKASYIAAIENADPDAFDTPGFIAGYVRSYARYLDMDPDKAFDAFCNESGFSVAHGMSAEASVVNKPTREERLSKTNEHDIFSRPAMPFAPTGDGVFARIEPAAIGSSLVLVALIAAIGFGGWSVLKEVQRVQVSPVDQTPVVLSDLDPLQASLPSQPTLDNGVAPNTAVLADAPRVEALDRLYRPAALDVPVLVARDAPIASLDPRTGGLFETPVGPNATTSPDRLAAAVDGAISDVLAEGSAATGGLTVPQVLEGPAPAVQVVATSETWVRVTAADGTNIYEKVMQKGDTFDVPALEEAPLLRTGQSGAVYFVMNGEFFGPVGGRGSVTSNVPLHQQALAELYEPAQPGEDSALEVMVAEMRAAAEAPAETTDQDQ
ncbi:helix-turn-helix domain-containing protein [Sulfitobacter donghicola]|uniref:4-hydroxy-3-methylbut-2-en-1-yl diphosphate synthase n=1 Tax=Sulfitobacter donghicola DSW-25 = KCTC 12864 = JCM 14565 TaxID=1300350 RepID=A0A073IXF6_9RHOB|nr:helix-turn-helix domain-containing protein [Sulfitobacter donghicola]KEJ90042.1 4-hydroxy-3-methylbut-2-en-1-yl diphosphate synthase [Sulfitobacter donghicola DSW-25 = KCTC 12864 = JCM 14565]KIN66820.1 4-hydroxy-3-methylbut-2-en-1-yl diphosphate synthase [Sulfitobacter donghicola DSW-25 = KCTC 12864 = JCM 14565]